MTTNDGQDDARDNALKSLVSAVAADELTVAEVIDQAYMMGRIDGVMNALTTIVFHVNRGSTWQQAVTLVRDQAMSELTVVAGFGLTAVDMAEA